ncbi:MAG: phosphate acyltransferase, partial [Candidatus Omnitrophica bacterium]|nr:phosphate acyltransferase [Candidatus Omnitrophota bacterium]
MDTIRRIREKAKARQRTIVLPEYQDARVVEAARIIEKEGLAKVLLLSEDKIDQKEKDRYIAEFYEMH